MLRLLVLLLLLSDVAMAAEPMLAHSLGNKATFKIAMSAEISKELHAQLRNEMLKMKLEPVPKGAVAPGGVRIDSAFVGPKREVIAISNKFILEKAKSDQLYSVGNDFWYYSSRKENGFPISIYLGNISHDQAVQVIKKITTLQPARGTASEQIAGGEESKFISAETQAMLKQAANDAQAFALREVETFKHSENYQNAVAGCWNGYAQVWETYWARPVRTVATMMIHPIDSGTAIKEEVLGYWDGGWPMIENFFASAYNEISDFGNWSIEKKSQLFCNLQATGGVMKLAKVYYPKPANNAALVMSEEVKKAALDIASDEPLPRLGLQDLLDAGVPRTLASRLAQAPEMAKTYLRLMRAKVAAVFQIDEGITGKPLVSKSNTAFGTERITISTDGKMTVSYHADAFYNQPTKMITDARNGLQEAIAQTRTASGNMSYEPARYWDVPASPGVAGARSFGHYGGIILNLNGTAEDMTFLQNLRRAPEQQLGSAPVLMRPSSSP